MRRVALFALLPFVAAWSAAPSVRRSGAAAKGPRVKRRCRGARAFSEDKFDKLVFYGDAGVLVGYGAVQAIVDASLMPLATAQPELFTQSEAVLAAPLQGIVLAALWCSITVAVGGYRAGATRTLPTRAAIVPLVSAWLLSSLILVAGFAAAGLDVDAELEFVLGSATVVGGWRVLYSNRLPLL